MTDKEKLDDLLGKMLHRPWHKQCEVIEDYMPPFPDKNTRPTVVVQHKGSNGHVCSLRYSAGPRQGFFWDSYGDDMQTWGLAVVALYNAPAPPCSHHYTRKASDD